MDITLFELIRANFAFKGFLYITKIHFNIVLKRNILKCHGEQFSHRITDNCAQRIIYLKPSPVESNECHCDGGIIKRTPKAFLALFALHNCYFASANDGRSM